MPPAGSTAYGGPRPGPGNPQLPRLGLIGPLVLATVSALLYGAATRRFRYDWWRFLDLSIYRDGARTVLHGHPLYGGVQFLHNSWTNTPFTAVLFIPLEGVHGLAIHLLAILGNAALLVSVVALTLVGLRVRVDRRFVAWLLLLTAISLWIEPVMTTIRLGQVNLLLVVLVLVDLAALDTRSGRGRRWCGVGIGLAAGIKLTPGLFVVYLVLRRRFRAAVVAAVTGLATVVAGFVVAPGSSKDYWLDGAVVDTGRVGPLRALLAQSLHSSVVRELGSSRRSTAIWLLADVATAVVGLLLAAAVGRAGHEMLAVATVGLLACLVSPFSWSHHWVWFVPLLVVGAVEAARRASLIRWVPVAALWLLIAGWITGHPYPASSTRGPHIGLIDAMHPAVRQLTSNLYPLLAYLLLAVLVVVLAARSGRPGVESGSGAVAPAGR